jgi:O-antigen/teichoic acid export membrane protein
MDQLLVGSTLGAAALARYSICLQLAQYVNLIPTVMMQIVVPRVSALGERLDARSRNALLRSTTLIAFGMACALALVLALLAKPLLTLWISPEFAHDNQWLLIVLAAIHALLAFAIGAYFILLGTGQVAQSAKITLSAALVQAVVAVLLAPFGLLAFACNRLVYALGSALLYRVARVREPAR